MKTSALDRLVKEVTAFDTWNDLVTCIRQRGYVPTLNGGKAHSKLCDVLRRNGYKVFRNGLVS